MSRLTASWVLSHDLHSFDNSCCSLLSNSCIASADNHKRKHSISVGFFLSICDIEDTAIVRSHSKLRNFFSNDHMIIEYGIVVITMLLSWRVIYVTSWYSLIFVFIYFCAYWDKSAVFEDVSFHFAIWINHQKSWYIDLGHHILWRWYSFSDITLSKASNVLSRVNFQFFTFSNSHIFLIRWFAYCLCSPLDQDIVHSLNDFIISIHLLILVSPNSLFLEGGWGVVDMTSFCPGRKSSLFFSDELCSYILSLDNISLLLFTISCLLFLVFFIGGLSVDGLTIGGLSIGGFSTLVRIWEVACKQYSQSRKPLLSLIFVLVSNQILSKDFNHAFTLSIQSVCAFAILTAEKSHQFGLDCI